MHNTDAPPERAWDGGGATGWGRGVQNLEALVAMLALPCAVRTATLEVLRRELLTAEQLLTCVTDEVRGTRMRFPPAPPAPATPSSLGASGPALPACPYGLG